MSAESDVEIEQVPSLWIVRVVVLGIEQAFYCASEEMASKLAAVFTLHRGALVAPVAR